MKNAISKFGRRVMAVLISGAWDPKAIREIAEADKYATYLRAVCNDGLLADRIIQHCLSTPGGWRALPALVQICQRGETSWDDVRQIILECPTLIRDPDKAVARFKFNRCPWDYFRQYLTVNGPTINVACMAHQVSDQMTCDRCTQTWDMNDPEPPPCVQPTVDGG